ATDRLPGTGEIVDASGRVVGQHGGIHRYTIGQRRGIGIADERPLYVISLDAGQNRVTVGPQEELLGTTFTAAGVNWVAFAEPGEQGRAGGRGRSRHTQHPARTRNCLTTWCMFFLMSHNALLRRARRQCSTVQTRSSVEGGSSRDS